MIHFVTKYRIPDINNIITQEYCNDQRIGMLNDNISTKEYAMDLIRYTARFMYPHNKFDVIFHRLNRD